MSGHQTKKGTKTAIKLAAKEAEKRTSNGGADPGPGDLSAEPSSMPVTVDVPPPPTPSELIVKSTSASKKSLGTSKFQTIKEPARSGTLPSSSAASGLSSDRQAGVSSLKASSFAPTSKSLQSSSKSKSKSSNIEAAKTITAARESTASSALSNPSDGASTSGSKSASNFNASPTNSVGSGTVHDEIEVGEGELVHPSGVQPSGPQKSPEGISRVQPSGTSLKSGGNLDSTPVSSGGGKSKMSTKTGALKTVEQSASSRSRKSDYALRSRSPSVSDAQGSGKKVTKFRYHKRITVRTKGKTNPSAVMAKVTQKDHNTGITMSTIDNLDPSEIMKRVGIPPNKKAHWRVRMRQTKRVTKGGKTTTETKVAYRDSEGNKRIKSSSNPFCKNCGKKLEECSCETSE